MKTLKNYSELVSLVNNNVTVDYRSVDLEFDLFEHAQCERNVNGYAVKDFENGVSLIEAGSDRFALTDNVEDLIASIGDFHINTNIPEDRYKAYVSANKETSAFDSVPGSSKEAALSSAKKKYNKDKKDLFFWAVYVHDNGSEEKLEE
jgi:hypothetical protein